jgi:hypothetical protein
MPQPCRARPPRRYCSVLDPVAVRRAEYICACPGPCRSICISSQSANEYRAQFHRARRATSAHDKNRDHPLAAEPPAPLGLAVKVDGILRRANLILWRYHANVRECVPVAAAALLPQDIHPQVPHVNAAHRDEIDILSCRPSMLDFHPQPFTKYCTRAAAGAAACSVCPSCAARPVLRLPAGNHVGTSRAAPQSS